MNAFACERLTRFHGLRPALREVTLAAAPGEIIALIGDNGAGKSTLLRVLATLLRPDGGRCEVLGVDVSRAGHGLRARIGWLGHESGLDRALSPAENLRLFADLYGRGRDRLESLLEPLRLFADTPVGELSRGQEQQAALARSLVHSPALWLLDEPTNALDPGARLRLWEMMKAESSRGACVVFSTHDQEAARAVAHRVAKLEAGRLAPTS